MKKNMTGQLVIPVAAMTNHPTQKIYSEHERTIWFSDKNADE